MEALREGEAFRRIVTIALDLTPATRAGLIDGVLKLVISHPLALVASTAIRLMSAATAEEGGADVTASLVPFDIFTPENI